MSTTSKYANLPFIASGERDVYETDDLPESDQQKQQQSNQQQPDSSIEIITTNTVDAFNKFAIADSNVSTSKSLDSTDNKISIVEKYKQIKSDIEDLKQFINNASEQQSKDDESSNMSKDIEQLFSNLQNLHDFCYKKFDTTQLLNDLRSDESTFDSKNQQQSKQPSIIYELYRKQDKDSILELARINSLEERIKKIETTIGGSINDIQSMVSNDDQQQQQQHSIMNIIVNLSNKIYQLDYSQLDRLDVRLQLIIDKLNQIRDKKSVITELDKEDKLNEIYQNYIEIEQFNQFNQQNDNKSMLLNIVERLKILNDLHQEGQKFSNTINSMESMQLEILDKINDNRLQLQHLQKLFDNVKNVQLIVDDFQNRLNNLIKK